MDSIRTSIITDGFCLLDQAFAGTLKFTPQGDKAKRQLLARGKQVEESYLAGEISAGEVLLRVASHFNDERLIRLFQLAAEEPEIQNEPAEDRDEDDPELPDLDEITEREAVLAQDPDLSDVEETPWITSVWPSTVTGKLCWLHAVFKPYDLVVNLLLQVETCLNGLFAICWLHT